MRNAVGQVPEATVVRPVPEVAVPVSYAPSVREIPFDYVAKFELEGRHGNRVQQVINISIEGAFVAVAIGYSFIPARLPDRAADLDQVRAEVRALLDSLTTGSRIRAAGATGAVRDPFEALANDIFMDPRMLIQCLLVRLCGINFKYSIVDSGTGRELQNQPIHNIAGLGEPTGDRPFRPFAKPMLFMPRSTIRIEIEEISDEPLYGYHDADTNRRVGAQLFIVLHGYKILGYGTALP